MDWKIEDLKPGQVWRYNDNHSMRGQERTIKEIKYDEWRQDYGVWFTNSRMLQATNFFNKMEFVSGDITTKQVVQDTHVEPIHYESKWDLV